MRIRLTRKLAAVLNGIDVSTLQVGDTLDLPDRAAEMMIAERWAERVAESIATHLPGQKPIHPDRPN
jgi:hypothetical protein